MSAEAPKFAAAPNANLSANSGVIPAANSLVWPLAAVTLAVLVHFQLALTRAINWDEFFHYSQIHQLLAGELNKPLQTLHTRVFAWVVELPGSGIDHILTIRPVMTGFLCLAAWCTGLIAERFTSRRNAAICALLYLTAGFVLQHGSSFRADALTAGLLMASLAILLRSRLGVFAIFAAAILAALASLETIKSILYAPAFAGVAWLRWQEYGRSKDMTLRLIALLLSVAILFGLFYWFHISAMGTQDSSDRAGGLVSSAASHMFFIGTPPQLQAILKGLATAPIIAICALLVPFAAMRSSLPKPEKIALIGLWAPFLTLAFYSNTYPYFFTFMLAPVAASCAVIIPLAVKRYGLILPVLAPLVAFLGVWMLEESGTLDRQKSVVAAGENIFEEPVSYFDFPAMLGKEDKANTFLTHWGHESYLRNGPAMAETMLGKPVPLLIENDPSWTSLLRETGPAPLFMPQDVIAIRETYVHFWGPYWIAGVELEAGADQTLVNIRVPGIYSVESGALRLADGSLLVKGETFMLERGVLTITPEGTEPLKILWGSNLQMPNFSAPTQDFWTQF